MYETCSYIAGEVGTTNLDAGNTIQFGYVDMSNTMGKNGSFLPFNWVNVNIGPFSDTGVVLTQTNTYNDPTPVTTRVTGITDRLFRVLLQESEEDCGTSPPTPQHGTERVAWVAMNKGTYNDTINNIKLIRHGTTVSYSSVPGDVNYPTFFNSTPAIIAKPSTMRGANPCNLRIRYIKITGFNCLIREEYSFDSETKHMAEAVAYFAIGN